MHGSIFKPRRRQLVLVLLVCHKVIYTCTLYPIQWELAKNERRNVKLQKFYIRNNSLSLSIRVTAYKGQFKSQVYTSLCVLVFQMECGNTHFRSYDIQALNWQVGHSMD